MNSKDPEADVIEFPEHKTIEQQATEWMVKLDDGEPSAALRLAFKQWVNEAPAHHDAFEKAVVFSNEMNVLTQVVLPREEVLPAPRFFNGMLVAACSVMLVVIGLLVAPSLLTTGPQLYTTQIGEQKTIELADNSTVLLNTNSQLKVHFTAQRRQLTLLQGEAHFKVAHNPERPFEVSAGEGLVRAIGTAFTIHLREADVEVIVTEGTVELDKAEPESEPESVKVTALTVASPLEQGLKVKAGSRLTYDRNVLAQVQQSEVKELAKDLSWHQGVLTFDGESLEQAVAEISRYTDLKIVIPERAARELKVGGIFKVGDTGALFEALKDGFGMHVTVVSDDVVYLISEENHY